MDIENALMQMVKAARRAMSLDATLKEAGYADTPYNELYGTTADAIYYLIGEQTRNYGESITHLTLTSESVTDEQRVTILMHQIKKNVPPDSVAFA